MADQARRTTSAAPGESTGRTWAAVCTTVHALLVAALTVWSLCGPFAWILRDGLGPESVESGGWEALRRAFWTFSWGPILLGLVLAKTLWWRFACRSDRPAARDARRPR